MIAVAERHVLKITTDFMCASELTPLGINRLGEVTDIPLPLMRVQDALGRVGKNGSRRYMAMAQTTDSGVLQSADCLGE